MGNIKKSSLKDVAAKAGVSTALASFVLNGKGKEYRVGEQTAKHILSVATEMNYQPNMAAKSLRSGKTNTIGVVVSDISNPFFSQISRCIEDEAAKRGYTVLFGSSDEDVDKLNIIVSNLLSKGVDGMIIVPCENSAESITGLAESGKTSILLLDRTIPGLNVSYVGLNNFSAAYNATVHLLDAGFKTPGMVAYDIALTHMRERIRGYKKAMADRGLKDNIRVGYLKHNSVRKSADKVVQVMTDAGADALILATNTISIACLYAIQRLNIRVPERLGLVGFDGSDAFEFFYSPLTYTKQPVDVIAQKAVEIITDQIANKNRSVQSMLIEGELVVRKSSSKR